jgi:hypothetical protein
METQQMMELLLTRIETNQVKLMAKWEAERKKKRKAAFEKMMAEQEAGRKKKKSRLREDDGRAES